MSYYYISLKWTRKNNSVFTIWCSNHSGYTQILEKAGIYEKKYEKHDCNINSNCSGRNSKLFSEE